MRPVPLIPRILRPQHNVSNAKGPISSVLSEILFSFPRCITFRTQTVNTFHSTLMWIHKRVLAHLVWTLLAPTIAILLPRYSMDFSNVIDYATALSHNGRNRIGIVRRTLRKRSVNLRLTLLCLCLQFGSSIVITTYVDDVNDNTPYFVNTPYTADISESTPVGKHCTRSKLPVRFIYFYFNPSRGVHSEYPSPGRRFNVCTRNGARSFGVLEFVVPAVKQ